MMSPDFMARPIFKTAVAVHRSEMKRHSLSISRPADPGLSIALRQVAWQLNADAPLSIHALMAQDLPSCLHRMAKTLEMLGFSEGASQLISVQNPSIIPLYWLDYRDSPYWIIIIPNILGSIIPYNHQPTGVLNAAQFSFVLNPLWDAYRTSSWRSDWSCCGWPALGWSPPHLDGQ